MSSALSCVNLGRPPISPIFLYTTLFRSNSATGVVTVLDATLLNFESATSHNITVKAADASGAFTTQTFAIAVTDQAPSTPTEDRKGRRRNSRDVESADAAVCFNQATTDD